MDDLTSKMAALKISDKMSQIKAKNQPTIVHLTIEGTDKTIPMTLFPKRVRIRTAAERNNFAGVQIDETEQGVRDWYAARGQEVPAADLEMCRQMREAEKVAEKLNDAIAERAAEKAEEVKPEFGTPAFWAWARKRKAEKNAERAAAGLPPLPSKKK